MNRRSKLTFATMVPLALGVVFAGLAWACTPANVWLDRGMAPPGESVTVSGEYFAKDATLDIYLSTDQTPSGRLLGSATGSQFSVGVTIPTDVPEGSYWVMVAARNGETNAGGGGASAGEALEVRYSQPSTGDPESPSNPGSNPGNNAGNENTSGNKSGDGSRSKADAPRGNHSVAATDERDAGRPAVAAVEAAVATEAAPVADNERSKENTARATSDVPTLKPSIEVGGTPAFADGRAPSLVPDRFGDSSAAADRSSNYLLYGGFLLTIVLMGLGAGFVVAVSERRKAEAGVRRDDETV